MQMCVEGEMSGDHSAATQSHLPLTEINDRYRWPSDKINAGCHAIAFCRTTLQRLECISQACWTGRVYHVLRHTTAIQVCSSNSVRPSVCPSYSTQLNRELRTQVSDTSSGLLQLRYEHDSSTIRARHNILRGVMCFRAIMNMSILSRCCRML